MPKPDDMICRKDVTTGSLIASTKVCMKRSEWNRNSEDQRSRWGDLQGRGYTNGDAVTMAPGQYPGPAGSRTESTSRRLQMLPMVMLISLPSMLWTAQSGSANAAEQM